jgi:hypothetical protein
MEEKLLRFMAQLGFIAVCVWVVSAAFGEKEPVKVPTPPKPNQQRALGDVWQRGCIAEPYAQGSFSPGLAMGRA